MLSTISRDTAILLLSYLLTVARLHPSRSATFCRLKPASSRAIRKISPTSPIRTSLIEIHQRIIALEKNPTQIPTHTTVEVRITQGSQHDINRAIEAKAPARCETAAF